MGIFGIKLKLTVPRMQWDRGNMQIHNFCRSLIFELLKCQVLNSPTHLVLSKKEKKAPSSYLSWLGDEKQGYYLEWPLLLPSFRRPMINKTVRLLIGRLCYLLELSPGSVMYSGRHPQQYAAAQARHWWRHIATGELSG